MYPNGATKIRFVWAGGTEPTGRIELGRRGLRLATAARVSRDLQARMQGELLQDVVNVPFHRIGGEVEALPDLLVAQPIRDQIEHRPLSRGHADGLGHLCRLASERVVRNVREERAGQRRWKNVRPARNPANGAHKGVERCVL